MYQGSPMVLLCDGAPLCAPAHSPHLSVLLALSLRLVLVQRLEHPGQLIPRYDAITVAVKRGERLLPCLLVLGAHRGCGVVGLSLGGALTPSYRQSWWRDTRL